MFGRAMGTRRIPEITGDISFETERPPARTEPSPLVEQPGVSIGDLRGALRPARDIDILRPPGGIFEPGGGILEPTRPPRPPFPPLPPMPPPGDPEIPRFSGPQTTTHLVNYAVGYLENLPREPLQSALNFIQGKPQQVQPGELFEELRQRTNFDEVLRETAEGWRPLTRRVFAEAFAMPADNLTAMDAIVCIALLNRPDLEQVLRSENAAPPSLQDLLENRKIMWQYPPPGTPLTPPYVIVVAVESMDTGPAEDIVQRIMSNLVATPSGYRLPRAAAQKLG